MRDQRCRLAYRFAGCPDVEEMYLAISKTSRLSNRAAVGMGIPMGIPMGMGMVWVWGL